MKSLHGRAGQPHGAESVYSNSPAYFDIDRIFLEYDWDEENFTLMKAQSQYIPIGEGVKTEQSRRSQERLSLIVWSNVRGNSVLLPSNV